jgi:hypothetical protein
VVRDEPFVEHSLARALDKRNHKRRGQSVARALRFDRFDPGFTGVEGVGHVAEAKPGKEQNTKKQAALVFQRGNRESKRIGSVSRLGSSKLCGAQHHRGIIVRKHCVTQQLGRFAPSFAETEFLS